MQDQNWGKERIIRCRETWNYWDRGVWGYGGSATKLNSERETGMRDLVACLLKQRQGKLGNLASRYLDGHDSMCNCLSSPLLQKVSGLMFTLLQQLLCSDQVITHQTSQPLLWVFKASWFRNYTTKWSCVTCHLSPTPNVVHTYYLRMVLHIMMYWALKRHQGNWPNKESVFSWFIYLNP